MLAIGTVISWVIDKVVRQSIVLARFFFFYLYQLVFYQFIFSCLCLVQIVGYIYEKKNLKSKSPPPIIMWPNSYFIKKKSKSSFTIIRVCDSDRLVRLNGDFDDNIIYSRYYMHNEKIFATLIFVKACFDCFPVIYPFLGLG